VQSKPVGRVTQRKAWQRLGASTYSHPELKEQTCNTAQASPDRAAPADNATSTLTVRFGKGTGSGPSTLGAFLPGR